MLIKMLNPVVGDIESPVIAECKFSSHTDKWYGSVFKVENKNVEICVEDIGRLKHEIKCRQ